MTKTISRRKPKGKIIISILIVAFISTFLVSVSLGKYDVSLKELLHVLTYKVVNLPQDWSNQIEAVVFQIRLPRVFAAMLVGAGLSAAGATFQGVFRNPIVSANILGVSAGAGFGAALGILLTFSYMWISFSAFIFGAAAVLISYLISRRVKHNPTLGMVLAGIIIGGLFVSATSYIKLVADPNGVLPAITYWLMGSLASIRIQDVLYAAGPILSGLVVLFIFRWKINVITMGEDEARTMGVNTTLLRLLLVAGATLITAACVSISGMIGWVGLVIPHCARMIIGHDYRKMLPASMLMGAIFLMIVDDIARLMSTSEVPLGILVSFIGAPFFLYLIISRRYQS